MLDIRKIKNEKEKIKKNLINRGVSEEEFDILFNLVEVRQEFLTQLEEIQSKRNSLSKEVGVRKKTNESVDNILAKMDVIAGRHEALKISFAKVDEQYMEALLNIPNTTLDEVPVGQEEDNVVLETFANIGRGLVKKQKSHYDLANEIGWIDTPRGVKVSGTRFTIFKGQGAKLLRALQSYMLDVNTSKGYVELNTPHLVLSKMLQGTGQLPKFKEDLFKVEGKDMWLIPTGEVSFTNYYAGEILDLKESIKLTGFTKCFRSEAGSSGKDTKGLIRSHEFNKVELVQLTSAEKGLIAFEEVLNDAKFLLKELGIPFRSLLLTTGNTGFSSKKTIDLELWLPSEQRYREVSSVSYFGDFQGRRASIRYKQDGKNHYAHTVNGSALAIDRVFASIIEIYQNKDGSVDIPEVLIPYMQTNKL